MVPLNLGHQEILIGASTYFNQVLINCTRILTKFSKKTRLNFNRVLIHFNGVPIDLHRIPIELIRSL